MAYVARLCESRWKRSLSLAGACGIELASRMHCGASVRPLVVREIVANSGRGVNQWPLLLQPLHTFAWSAFHAVFCGHELVPSSLLRGFGLELRVGRWLTKASLQTMALASSCSALLSEGDARLPMVRFKRFFWLI